MYSSRLGLMTRVRSSTISGKPRKANQSTTRCAKPRASALQHEMLSWFDLVAPAAEVLSGNLEVSLTTLPWLRNVRVREFACNQEVEDAVLASSCVLASSPVFLPALNAWGVDGGYSDFQILKARGVAD